eukprot:31491-Pelagococcus_subviridis.AAC.1
MCGWRHASSANASRDFCPPERNFTGLVASSPLRVIVHTSDDIGVELKGVRSGVKRCRGRGMKARDPGRRDAPAKVLKDRRSPRRRGRTGTSVITERA